MPNRVVRDNILSSGKVDKLTYPAEVFYRRLMSIVDDFGCGDGRVQIIRSALYPLRLDKVSESDVSKWIAECEKADLVRQYQSSGKPYIYILNFGQTVRQKKMKYPPPPDEVQQMQADDFRCKQMQADASLNETKRNGIETNGISRFDSSEYYQSAEEAFKEIQNDEIFIQQLLMLVHNAGFRTCTAITIVLAVKRFITIESAKQDFISRQKSEVKRHFVNWINKNASKLDEYGK